MRQAASGSVWLTTSAKQFIGTLRTWICFSLDKCILLLRLMREEIQVLYIADKSVVPAHRLSLCWLHIWRTDAAHLGENKLTVVSWRMSCSHPLHLPGAQPAAPICITHYRDFGRERMTELKALTDSCLLLVMSVVILLLSFVPDALLPKSWIFCRVFLLTSAQICYFFCCKNHMTHHDLFSHVGSGCGGVPGWGA